jgi:hypothetical protein
LTVCRPSFCLKTFFAKLKLFFLQSMAIQNGSFTKNCNFKHFIFDPLRTRNIYPFQKCLHLLLQELFCKCNFANVLIVFPAKHRNSKWQFYTFLFDPWMVQNSNSFQKMFATLATIAFFAPKTVIFGQNL